MLGDHMRTACLQLDTTQLFMAANGERGASPNETAGDWKLNLVAAKITSYAFSPLLLPVMCMRQCHLSKENAKMERDNTFEWLCTCKGMRQGEADPWPVNTRRDA
jgi:hypothetical protein